jgi:hypothetical protein
MGYNSANKKTKINFEKDHFIQNILKGVMDTKM